MRILFREARLEWKLMVAAFLASIWLGWALAASGSAVPNGTTSVMAASDNGHQADEIKRLAARNRRLEALVGVLEERKSSAATSPGSHASEQ